MTVLFAPVRTPLRNPLSGPLADRWSGWSIGAWTAGANTTLSTAGGKARATAVGANNPRISRHVTGLTEGVDYRVQTVTYSGTASSVFFRVSATQNLDAGDYVNQSSIGAIDETFTAPAGGAVYIGIVAVIASDGDYAEINETFTLGVA